MEFRELVVGVATFLVFEDGSIFHARTGKQRKLFPDKDGYLKFTTVQTPEKITRNFLLHRLMYELFIGPIPDGMTVDHIDGDKLNNHPSNFQLLTSEENAVKGNARFWKFRSPDGEVVTIYNLRDFCRSNDLHQGHMGAVHSGRFKNYLSHKGWTKA